MKVRIDTDEWWPVYFINKSSNYGFEADVPEDTLARWDEVNAAFLKAQEEMESYDPKKDK